MPTRSGRNRRAGSRAFRPLASASPPASDGQAAASTDASAEADAAGATVDDGLGGAPGDLWARYTAAVEPLAARKRRAQEPMATRPRVDPLPPVHAPSHHPPPPPAVALTQGGGAVPGLDRRSTERLRAGAMPIDGRIYLHGLTVAEAHRALNGFLLRMEAAGARCVLVITGKGGAGRSDSPAEPRPFWEEQAGALRRELPFWLTEGPHAGRVVAFSQARPQHGGAGAFYVLLRRRRGG